MEFNVILAGVGGQGILTIAQAISLAAMRRGWSVKQAEVHGMAQRGGAVQSHLRFSDRELFSDIVPIGKADMILAVEPMEALRYIEFLGKRGTIVSSTVPFVNIRDYPQVESVLERIAKYPNHVLVDADRLARAAGSTRAVNTVMLGAASGLLGFDACDMEASIAEMFARKGDAVVQVNQRALRFGRNAAAAYSDGLQRGATAGEIRHWIESLPPEQLGLAEGLDLAGLTEEVDHCELSLAEGHAVAQTLEMVHLEGRRQLYEHEVYRLVELVGAISPPRHCFIPNGESVTADLLDRFPGEKVVLKVVSPQVVHKSDAGAVVFVPRDVDTVNREVRQLMARMESAGRTVVGILLVEFVERGGSGFGQELFVGIRSTREFGAIIAAGLGGVDTEYLAHKMKPGIAVAKALAVDTSPEEFLELFKKTAAYEILSGRARGHHRVVSDGELLRCFRAFIAVARRFCADRGMEGPDLAELEVNPFAFQRQRLIPLDGRGRLGTATKTPQPRPLGKIEKMLEPKTVAIVGVSTKRANFARIILDNVLECGFSTRHIYVVKEGVEQIDGVRCVPNIAALPEKIDLLVLATASQQLPELIEQVIESRKVASVILIPGGIGEKEGTENIEADVRAKIFASRDRADGGPIVLGGNCMGVRSRPGHYDTFFIPPNKHDPRRSAAPRRVALISQSGAFIVSRMSNLELLDPMIAVSLGNQIDLTVSDMLRTIGDRDDIDSIGVYVEGFNDMDGLAFVRAVRDVAEAGKTVIFYKAGRTEPGRAATAGHTASVAGDYDICQTAVANAGAIVTDTFKEFEQLLELATGLHGKTIGGRRIGVISNAGFETVGMADAILGTRYHLEIPKLADDTLKRLRDALAAHRLDALVNVQNPLDLTPMADESAYESCIRAMIGDENVDAVIVSCVPLTPQLRTTPEEIGAGSAGEAEGQSLADVLPDLLRQSPKPVIAVVDSGQRYETLVHRLREGGIPTFRTCDQAVRSLGRYLCHRSERVPLPRYSEGGVSTIECRAKVAHHFSGGGVDSSCATALEQ